MDPNITVNIDGLIAEAKALRAELDRVRASRHPSKAGVGVFAKFVIPSGYKRLARQVGSLWLDSSFQAQMTRLEGIGRAWQQRVHNLLGTVRTLPAAGRHTMTPRRLQTSFAKTQRYDRLDPRLRNGLTFLDELKGREVVHVVGPPEPQPSEEAGVRPAEPGAKLQDRAAPVQTLFPSAVIDKLPEPVKKSIEQAVESYHGGMYEPAAVMLRKALQNAIVLRFEAEGVGNQVLRRSGEALSFPKLVEKAQQARLIASQQAKELMRVKWLGDTAAHSYANEITKEDIDGVVLIVRLALERIFTIRIRPTTEHADEEP